MERATDVFIIGGGPAGLAAAIAARQRGLDVVVADGGRPPIDKPCGEGLMPDGRAALARLGISVPEVDSHSFRGVSFTGDGLHVAASFPKGVGIGVRRTVLHRLMVARAEAVGVSLLWQTPVTGLHPDGVRLGGQIVHSRWIAGADGGHSLVRRWAGLDRYHWDRTRFAFRRHYRVSPWSDCMELHWGAKCQIYITPVAQDEICVALVSRDPHLRLDTALPAFPEIASRLRDAEPTSAERGAISSTRKLRQVYQGRVALVGDASGAVDSITGEGLCLTFLQAQVLAECFAAGDLRSYQQQHRVLSRRPALISQFMLALDWKTSLRQRVMRACDSDPQLFRRMLAMHVGALSPSDFAADSLSLGWRLLSA
ncbi:MAG TPA: NAD(P)/FAD-dependent oxidoreductase [Candidatus Acidoferrales bacterium]|jgi:flavin-dependent dehydrogenase|nr:NAD(P)/FAD-dependent oxidoreductase [Candidatus Acidoferrales bacterium]